MKVGSQKAGLQDANVGAEHQLLRLICPTSDDQIKMENNFSDRTYSASRLVISFLGLSAQAVVFLRLRRHQYPKSPLIFAPFTAAPL